MKKFFAVLCACLCFGLTVTAYAENESEAPVESVVSESVVSTESGDEPVDETGSGVVSEIVSEAESEVASEAESEAASAITSETTSDDGYNIVDPENIIVNYASTEEELPHIDALIWSICGVLMAGCLVIFAVKFIKWRQSK